MTSSLAAQLAQSSSLNASLYTDRTRRKYAESYLFSSRDASQHDFYSLHALGLNGLTKLKALNPVFGQFESTIFSDSARNVDRTLQSQAQNADLNRILDNFLKQLGPYLMEAAASKALEWVIRRFRINEFNVDALMTLFMPYHETPHFTKLVSILHIETDLWRFLIPLKSAAQPLPRVLLINEMMKNSDLARFIFNLLPESLEGGWTHHALVGFTAGVAIEYIARHKRIKENTLTFMLPAASRLCDQKSNQECVLVGYTMFSALSQRCRLNPDVLAAILAQMFKGQIHAEASQLISFAVALLAPQDQLQELPDSIMSQILLLPQPSLHLIDSLKWIGSEKFIIALLPGLLHRIADSKVERVLDSLLLAPVLPNPIIEILTRSLLLLCVPLPPDSRPVQFLRTIYQKYSSIYSRIISNVRNEIEEPEMLEKVENLTRLVTLPSFTLNDVGQLILISRLEEPNNRQQAVRDLIHQLKEEDLTLNDRKDIEKALRDRICDDQVAVVEALYSSHPAVLPIFKDISFIKSVSKALTSSDISRGVMRLHFNFMAGSFVEQYPEFAPTIFEDIFLPFILYSKPRQKTAQLAWDIVINSPFASYELLTGCKDILSKHVTQETTRTDDMAQINLDIASRIAENVISSASFPNHVDMLLQLIQHTDTHIHNMSYLICRSLLSLLSGIHQIEIAQRLLTAMDALSLSDLQDLLPGKTSIQEAINDETLSKAVMLKPNSSGTKHRLQLAILALIPVIKRPPGIMIDWLPGEISTSVDKRGTFFAALMRDMYKLLNTSIGSTLSAVLLKALFVNLREETLLLLVGVWTHHLLNQIPDSEDLIQIAILHTLAFLRAQAEDSHSPQDFQTILPALLIALHADSRSIRSSAMDCIFVIAQSTKSTSASTVYAVDTIYGDKSALNLQYLEWSDFSRFVTSLESYRKHCTNDKNYLGIIAQDLLQTKRADSKKDASHKEKVLCYLLSHVLAWGHTEARIILLQMLKNVSHEVKLQMLLPTIQALISGDQLKLPDQNLDQMLQYWQLLLRAYDLKSVSELNDPSSDARDVFVRLIRAGFTDDSVPSSISKSVLDQLSGNFFSHLPLDLQRECCIILIESAALTSALKPLIKENFGPLLNNPTLIASLLSHFQPEKENSEQRASKRAKTTNDADDVSPDYLTVWVEILVAYPMPGSPELLSCLLDTLATICHGHTLQSEVHYTIQLFMTIIESTISSISDTTQLVPNALRMEILVELLRISDNPQTFNQALLVIASMARLAPEFVMQNVMPIFTFMGSNVFHRDDSYSFRVVQKTVDSIVPVVVDSLKKKHPEPFGLLKASSDFLRVFTDAATHVPRHRRTQFFVHFVEILGRDDFLIPVCLLLIEKSHRVVRQKSPEVAGTLGLPVAIIQAQSKAPPFKVIYQLLQEATNLNAALTSNEPSNDCRTFLDISKDSTTTRTQINAILIFIDILLQQSIRTGSTTDTTTINDSITLLLRFANAPTVDSEEHIPQHLDTSSTAIKALGHLLGVISVSEFVSSIEFILQTSNSLTEVGALNLLASRLSDVSPNTRLAVAPTIINILAQITKIVENGRDVQSQTAALAAFQSVAQSAVDQEIPSLAKALPLLLKAANKSAQLKAPVSKCIMPLSTKLGPRILPVFRDVVRFCGDILRNAAQATDVDKGTDPLTQDVQTNLVNLLSSIPQFWTVDDLVGLIGLTLETPTGTVDLRRTMTKRVPSQQLLPALLRVWSRSVPHHLREMFFELVKRVMRNADRSVVHENLREIFKLFLEAFEDIQGAKKDFGDLENFCMASFVEFITKLNETAFKPLYHRLFDWAFNDATDNRVNRQITFCSAMIWLIRLLKGLVTPYLDLVLNPLLDLLNSQSETNHPFELWTASIELLDTSLTFDEGVFWRVDRLNKLGPCLVKQLAIYPNLSSKAGNTQILQSCLNNLVAVLEDDLSLKKLHIDILMQTRSEDPDVRLVTLQTLVALWESQGEKLAGFLTDIITFIVECAEDEHDNVSKAARALKRAVEKRTGNLDALLGK